MTAMHLHDVKHFVTRPGVALLVVLICTLAGHLLDMWLRGAL